MANKTYVLNGQGKGTLTGVDPTKLINISGEAGGSGSTNQDNIMHVVEITLADINMTTTDTDADIKQALASYIEGMVIPDNEIWYFQLDGFSDTSGGGSGITSVVAGTNVTIDDTDPLNPIINATGGSSTIPSLQAVTDVGFITNHTIIGSDLTSNLGFTAGRPRSLGAAIGILVPTSGTPAIYMQPEGIASSTLKFDNFSISNNLQLPDVSGTLAEGITDGTTTVHADITGKIDISSLLGGGTGSPTPSLQEVTDISNITTNSIVGVTELLTDNTTKLASTAWVKGQSYLQAVSTFSQGSVPYANASGILKQDATGLNYDGTYLSVGNNNPGAYSGFNINGGRASIDAALGGMRYFVGPNYGPVDTAKSHQWYNRGVFYMSLSSPGSVNTLTLNGNHIPNTTDAFNLGSTSNRWNNIYVKNIAVGGTVTGAAWDLKADLVAGKVPASQLPGYVDQVQEFTNLAAFPATGTVSVIYEAIDTLKIYRWGGTTYAEISSTVALGETSATAYRGDRGKTAYDHSQLTTGNPHGVTKTDVGLGNLDNTSDVNKPISTSQYAALALKTDRYSTLSTKVANYTLLPSDEGKDIEMNNATANTVTINDTTLSAMPVGSKINVVQYGAGQTQVVATGSAVLLSAGGATKIALRYGWLTIQKRSATEYYILGDITV